MAQRALLQGWLTDVHPTVFSTISSTTAVQVRVACAAVSLSICTEKISLPCPAINKMIVSSLDAADMGMLLGMISAGKCTVPEKR